MPEARVHGRPVSFVASLFEGELNDLAERPAVLLVLGLGGDVQDVV